MAISCTECGQLIKETDHYEMSSKGYKHSWCPTMVLAAERCDAINHPKHYTFGKLEVIDVIEDWNLNFNLGNAVKYIARAPHKGAMLEDLRKAKWYLERQIKLLEKEKGSASGA